MRTQRFTSGRRVAVWLAIVAIGIGHVPRTASVFAASPANTSPRAVAPAAGRDVPEVALLRRFARILKESHKRHLVAKAERIELALDVLTATTPAEYHAAVRRLPMTIVRESSSGGGLVTRFVVRGKIRLEFTRAAPPVPAFTDGDDPSGHQSGPLARSECYLEEEEPCLTPQEEDDWAIEIAYAAAETDAAEADITEAQNHWNMYCQYYPSDPDCAQTRSTGPSLDGAAPGCATEALAATATMWQSALTWLAAKGRLDDAKISGKALSRASVVAARATMYGAAFSAGFAAGWFLGCVTDRYIVHAPDHLTDVPVPGACLANGAVPIGFRPARMSFKGVVLRKANGAPPPILVAVS